MQKGVLFVMSKFKKSGTIITEKYKLIVPVYLTKLENSIDEIYAAEAIRCGDVPDKEGWQPLYTIYWLNKRNLDWQLPDKIIAYGIKYNCDTGKCN